MFTPSFTGKQLDPDTGLYYYNARWYDPSLGRFKSKDPARDDINWFAYCGDNPLASTDPTGLIVETIWDLASLGTGVVSFIGNVKQGNVGGAVLDAVGVVAAAAAVALPFVLTPVLITAPVLVPANIANTPEPDALKPKQIGNHDEFVIDCNVQSKPLSLTHA